MAIFSSDYFAEELLLELLFSNFQGNVWTKLVGFCQSLDGRKDDFRGFRKNKKTRLTTSIGSVTLSTPVHCINSLNANTTKWSNTLKQFVDNMPTNCLIMFDHFVELALNRLNKQNGRKLFLLS